MERLENASEAAVFEEIMAEKFLRLIEICILRSTESTIYTKQDKYNRIYIKTHRSKTSKQLRKRF